MLFGTLLFYLIVYLGEFPTSGLGDLPHSPL